MLLVDIGGTNTRILVTDEKGSKIFKNKIKTNTRLPNETFNYIINIAVKYSQSKIGISLPGPADFEKGIILSPPNLQGWKGFNIKAYLNSSAIKFEKITLESDSNAMALSNHFDLGGKENDVTLFYTISTGIGCGLIINNKIYRGFSHLSTEIAKSHVSKTSGAKNPWGQYSLEYFSGGKGIEYRAHKNKVGRDTKDVFDSYKTSLISKKIIEEAADTLARVISIGINYLNPSKIIFDGAIARNEKWYINIVIQKIKDMVISEQYNQIKFNFANQNDDAALNGIALVMKGQGWKY